MGLKGLEGNVKGCIERVLIRGEYLEQKNIDLIACNLINHLLLVMSSKMGKWLASVKLDFEGAFTESEEKGNNSKLSIKINFYYPRQQMVIKIYCEINQDNQLKEETLETVVIATFR